MALIAPVVRITLAVVWFQGASWKAPPDFAALGNFSAAGSRSAVAVRAAAVLKLISRDCSSAQGIGYRGFLSLTPSSYG